MEKMPLPSDHTKEMIIRAEEETDPAYGSKPEDRTPFTNYLNHGIINLDKPSGPTSHEIDTWVKKILEVEKTGHGGTLDPNVTGILPIGIGNAVRVISAISSAGKEYVCIAKFHKNVEENRVLALMNLFTTQIWQRPPIKSAVARVLRPRRIYYINPIEFQDNYVLFRVGCEAGTYIRKLCFDFGEVMLTGASMHELRRSRAGFFKEDTNLITLQDLNDAMYIYKNEGNESYLRRIVAPMELAVEHMDQIIVRDTAVDAICHGAHLAANGVLRLHAGIEKKDVVAVMTQKGEIVAFSEALQNARKIASLHSGLVAKTKHVLMERKTYPYWKKQKE